MHIDTKGVQHGTLGKRPYSDHVVRRGPRLQSGPAGPVVVVNKHRAAAVRLQLQHVRSGSSSRAVAATDTYCLEKTAVTQLDAGNLDSEGMLA
jgi:hypothetical protein